MLVGHNVRGPGGPMMSDSPAISGILALIHSPGRLAAALHTLKARLSSKRVGPLGGSAFIAGLFFFIWYLILHPGYWINDDLKAIWALVGYPAGDGPIPFLIHSNVLLGFFLDSLYGLPTQLNWAMILYAALNGFSIWMLLYLLLQSRTSGRFKVLGATILLGGLGAPTISLTYTFTAALASVAGMCLLLSAAKPGALRWRPRAFTGTALILAGSLIRLEMVGLVLAISVPTVLCLAGRLDRRRVMGVSVLAASLIGAAYGFNRLYVRLHPAWNYYYAYDSVREQLHDAHRLSNLHNQIRRVGWTPNDQELFAHWFFPDPGTYSYEHIRYLVDNTSATSQDPGSTVKVFLLSLATPRGIPYLALVIGAALWLAAARPRARHLVMALAPPATALATNLYLAWAYKDPDYVLASTLGASLALGIVAPLGWSAGPADSVHLEGKEPALPRLARISAMLLVTLGAGTLVAQALDSSNLNRARSDAYENILDDLEGLRANATIPSDALVVSPAHGLPYEWSYPFTLTRPTVLYFDTGWITFSPAYELVLRAYDIGSLPQSLLHDGRLYLMVDAGFTRFLQKYYSDHDGTAVVFDAVYAMPNALDLPGYDDIFLFKVRAVP